MVESYNGSLRGTSAIFIRRTKCYAKCLNSVYLGVKMWIYKKFIRDNLENIIGCCYGWLWGGAVYIHNPLTFTFPLLNFKQ